MGKKHQKRDLQKTCSQVTREKVAQTLTGVKTYFFNEKKKASKSGKGGISQNVGQEARVRETPKGGAYKHTSVKTALRSPDT